MGTKYDDTMKAVFEAQKRDNPLAPQADAFLLKRLAAALYVRRVYIACPLCNRCMEGQLPHDPGCKLYAVDELANQNGEKLLKEIQK